MADLKKEIEKLTHIGGRIYDIGYNSGTFDRSCEIQKAYERGLNDAKKQWTDAFDKIKAEIEALPKTYPFVNHIDTYVKEDDVKKIIDKYKKEGE